MGSLYDIGNMRYKHFTFYSRGSASEYTPLGSEYISDPDKTDEENEAAELLHPAAYNHLIAELVGFLEKVWPLDAIFGYNAEDDTAYVTYIKQTSTGTILIENIYTFRRSTVTNVAGTAIAKWMLALNPTKSVNPQDFINQETQKEND